MLAVVVEEAVKMVLVLLMLPEVDQESVLEPAWEWAQVQV